MARLSQCFDLRDFTFVIPFTLDSEDRLRNLRIVTEYLLTHFDTTILISEFADTPRLSLADWPPHLRESIRHCYFENPHPYFQRTTSVNRAVEQIETPFFAIYDTDVLLPLEQYLEGARLLREGACEMCLPFENRVMWIPREVVPDLMPVDAQTLAALDYGISDDNHIFLGLVNFLRREAFCHAGMMNERFKSWGYEEMELYIRLLKLGYRVLRTDGLAYHLGHVRGIDSGTQHPYFQENQQEYHRILALNADEILPYLGVG